MKQRVTTVINEDLYFLLNDFCLKEQRTVSQALRLILEKHFKKNEQKTKTKIQISEVDYLGYSDQFIKAWNEWIEHKKSISNGYKSEKTQSIAIASLVKQMNGHEKRMIDAIYFSIGNNYKGIYEQRNSTQKTGTLTEQFIQKIAGFD